LPTALLTLFVVVFFCSATPRHGESEEIITCSMIDTCIGPCIGRLVLSPHLFSLNQKFRFKVCFSIPILGSFLSIEFFDLSVTPVLVLVFILYWFVHQYNLLVVLIRLDLYFLYFFFFG
jgi:hypothetical protein